ncbi:MAG: copper chaperone PCu(A)C [Methylophilaceae bacterium]
MKILQLIILFGLSLLAGSAFAASEIVSSHAWARATAPGQEVGAAYITLQSARNTRLYKAESVVASQVEIHNMTMSNGVMQMRKLDGLALIANKATTLEPGALHLMLLGLKKPLTAGEKIKISLYFKQDDGKISVVHPQFSVISGENPP